jgi:hypothetical protein
MSQSAVVSEKMPQPQHPPAAETSEDAAAAPNAEWIVTTDLLLHRLNVGLGIAGGARGSLTKVAGSVLVSDGDAVTSPAALDDLRLFQIEMTKVVWIAQRQARELEQWQNKITKNPTTSTDDEDDAVSDVNTEQTPQESNTLQDLRDEWHRLQVLQSCFQEYEGMARLVMENGPRGQSESQLHSELKDVSQRIQTVQTELDHAEREFQMRQSQFHHFLTCLQDLKQSMPPLTDENDKKEVVVDLTTRETIDHSIVLTVDDEDDDETPESSQERRQTHKEGTDDDHNDPMQIDEDERRTEDADLYGDL